MIGPALLPLVTASPAALALLGTNPTRFWGFGEAPQKGDPGYGKPYAVVQTVYGAPQNYLNQRPDVDNWGVQVDAYALQKGTAGDVAAALRDCFEGAAHVVAWNGDGREPVTGLYRVSFTVEFWTPR